MADKSIEKQIKELEKELAKTDDPFLRAAFEDQIDQLKKQIN